MNQEKAHQLADDWIDAFNAHNLAAMVDHYAEKLELYLPFIPLLKSNESGYIPHKRELERYFQLGLATYLNLYFALHNAFVGIDTLTIDYTSANERLLQ